MAAPTTGQGAALTTHRTHPSTAHHPVGGDPGRVTVLRAPGSELVAVIGPDGSRRAALLHALGALPAVGRPVAPVRTRGDGAPDPGRRIGELLADLRTAGPASRVFAGAVPGETYGGPAGRGPHPDTRYAELPPADRLLLALTVALAERPAAVLVESADPGPDLVGRRRVWAGLRRVADSGVSVLAGCRTVGTAGRYAHRTVLLPHRTGLG
ncbi:hypothetical protein ACFYYR_08505 [Streptomyces sp. NPDC001922]|uniref:hypothetical protein n=1 Tax=Streptomyces sp. NPDC001922 TaxID=3364624 RepID=UPI00367B796A